MATQQSYETTRTTIPTGVLGGKVINIDFSNLIVEVRLIATSNRTSSSSQSNTSQSQALNVIRYAVLFGNDDVRIEYGIYDDEATANEIADLIRNGTIVPQYIANTSDLVTTINSLNQQIAELDAEIIEKQKQDANKLIVYVTIGVDNHSLAYFDRITSRFENKFDDSVIVITVPNPENDDIVITLYNTEDMTESQVESMQNQARSMVTAFRNR